MVTKDNDTPLRGALKIGLLALGLKCVLLLAVFVAASVFPQWFNAAAYGANFHWPMGVSPTLATHWETWDAQYYLYLAEFGYPSAGTVTGFWPLWPLVVRVSGYLAGGNQLIAGIVVANLLSTGAVMLLWDLVRRREGREVANATALLFLAFPTSFFLSLPYSEALFIFLCVASLHAAAKERPLLAAIAASFLPLTRAVGAAMFFPLAYLAYQHWSTRRSLAVRYLVASGAVLVGLGAYFIFMEVQTGHPLTGLSAQTETMAAAPSAVRLFDPIGFARAFVDVGGLHGIADSGLDRAMFLIFALGLIPLWRMNRSWFLFVVVVGLVPAVSILFMSFSRHILAAFPLLVVLAVPLAGEKRRYLRWFLIGLFLTLQVVLLLLHTNNYWVG